MAGKTAFGTYGASAREIAELFGDYLEYEAAAPALVLSARRASDVERDALAKSLAAFGYETPACTFATLAPKDRVAEGGDIILDPQALFALVEGLDPLFVIATDADSTSALAQAYRTQLDPDAPGRIFGRPAAIFKNLADLLATDQGKQKAWHILKSLNS